MTALLIIAVVFAGVAGAPLWLVLGAGLLALWLLWLQATA